MTGGDGLPHTLEELGAVVARVHEAVVLTEKLLAGISRDDAKLVARKHDIAFRVRDTDEGVLVERLHHVQEAKIQLTEALPHSWRSATGAALRGRGNGPCGFRNP